MAPASSCYKRHAHESFHPWWCFPHTAKTQKNKTKPKNIKKALQHNVIHWQISSAIGGGKGRGSGVLIQLPVCSSVYGDMVVTKNLGHVLLTSVASMLRACRHMTASPSCHKRHAQNACMKPCMSSTCIDSWIRQMAAAGASIELEDQQLSSIVVRAAGEIVMPF